MQQLTHIGLDVHKETIAVAVLRPDTVACDERVIPNTPEALRRLLAHYPDTSALKTCYEAGPTGYDTHRLVSSLGIDCDVIAPSLIPKRSGVRVKTDRLDARNLARLHRAGELTAVRVPTLAEEAVRDLVRAREEIKADRRIARQRIRSFLLRYGKRCPNVGGITCSRAAAVWWMPLLCDSQGLDALDFRLDSLSRIPEVDGALRIEPELRRIAEQPRQAQGHRRTDRPPTAQQLVDRLAGDAQSLG